MKMMGVRMGMGMGMSMVNRTTRLKINKIRVLTRLHKE